MYTLFRFAALTLALITIGRSQTVLYAPGGNVGNISGSNVGIGTTSPAGKLDVDGIPDNGSVYFRSSGRPFVDIRGGVNNYRTLRFSDASAGLGYRWDINTMPGNAGTPHALGFWSADGGQVLTIQQNGNVGIGTAGPSHKLEVVGPAANGAGNEGLWIDNNGVQFATRRDAGGGGDLQMGTPNYHNLLLMANGTTKMSITAGGNVGIGTVTPTTGLHVKGAFTPSYMQFTVQATSADDRAGISFLTASGTRAANFYASSDGHSYLTGTELSGGIFHIYTVGTERMVFLPNGNVGIGTSSPAQKLAVNGTIRAKEVIVDTGWSDYVFADDYRLAPLAEVEAHIRENKHLPGIPNAAEIEAGGVSVGDMQAKLLAKVEELTLHAIAQGKEIEWLKQQLASRNQNPDAP